MMWTKQKLEVRNSDQGIGHNTNGQLLLQNPQFNETVPSDRPLVKDLKKSEPMPTQFTCSIHPWMNAFVLIRDNPYMAVSAEDGSFEIKNIPAGPQQFAFWHEVKSYLRNLEVGEVKTDRKGIAKVDVPAGGTLDLGEIKVSAAILGK